MMKDVIIGALLLTISVQCIEEADMDPYGLRDTNDSKSESGLAAFLATVGMSIFKPPEEPAPPPTEDTNALSLSKQVVATGFFSSFRDEFQMLRALIWEHWSPDNAGNKVGLTGVHSLITRMSDHDRQRALRLTRQMYCGRMDACDYGRQMRLNMGRSLAEMSVDRTMELFDSVMMGIQGHDCLNMYRGCRDFE